MRGRAAVGLRPGDGNFGVIGQLSGAATHTLSTTEMPTHSHDLNITRGVNPTSTGIGTGGYLWGESSGGRSTLGAGGGSAHNNVQPSLTLTAIIKS